MKNNLKKIRIKNKISQEALAKKVGVSQQTVSSWENGMRTPKYKQMQMMEDLFGVKKENIFFGVFNYKSELNERKTVKTG